MNQLYLAEDFQVDARPLGEDQLVGVVIGAENSFQLNYPVRVSNAYVIRQRDKPILNLLRQMFLSYDTIMGYAPGRVSCHKRGEICAGLQRVCHRR